MKKARTNRCHILVMTVLCLVTLLNVPSFAASRASQWIPIRIGWNTTWSTEGQILECLKHTNIPHTYGLKPEFVGFSYGGPLSEAALAGQIDVLSAADQPSITLLSKDANWTVISRCITFRSALLVPPGSPAKSLRDLRGRKVAVPFGSGTHRVVVQSLARAGLEVGKDVRLINLDIAEINAAIAAGGPRAKTWAGDISAASSWDPHISIHTASRNAKPLYIENQIGLRTMSSDYIRRYPDAPVRFLKAIAAATLFYATHRDLANRWFAEDARVTYASSIMDDGASVDQNTRAKSVRQLRLGLTSDQIISLQRAADFAYQSKIISSRPDMKARTNLSYLRRATKELAAQPPSLHRVTVSH